MTWCYFIHFPNWNCPFAKRDFSRTRRSKRMRHRVLFQTFRYFLIIGDYVKPSTYWVVKQFHSKTDLVDYSLKIRLEPWNEIFRPFILVDKLEGSFPDSFTQEISPWRRWEIGGMAKGDPFPLKADPSSSWSTCLAYLFQIRSPGLGGDATTFTDLRIRRFTREGGLYEIRK